jgi:hypothetical protein
VSDWLLSRIASDNPTLHAKPGSAKSGLSMPLKRLMAQGWNRRQALPANTGVSPELRQKLTSHADGRRKSKNSFTPVSVASSRNRAI